MLMAGMSKGWTGWRMAEFEIKRAERSQAKLRLGLAGVSGGGKTWTALLLARGLVQALLDAGALRGTLEGKIGVIDTERSSASLYAHLVPFDRIDLGPPYTVPRYLGALKQFERAGYAVVIIDQVSHAWTGEGGILEVVESAKKGQSAGNPFGGWDVGTPLYNDFVDGLLNSNVHLICTMRQKTSWQITEKQNRSGRMVKTPERIGMAPVQREGFEYELTTLLSVRAEDNAASSLKDRSGLFPALEWHKLGEKDGARLASWLISGAVVAADADEATPRERLEAATDAAVRRCQQAATLPDLVRVFTEVQTTVRGFVGELEASTVRPFLDRVIAAKDERKAVLGEARTEGVDAEVITPEDVDALEGMMLQACIPMPQFLAQVGVERLVLMPAGKYDDAVNWICSQALARHGVTVKVPARKVEKVAPPPVSIRQETIDMRLAGRPADLLAPAKVGAFDDMEDDLPWKD